MRAASHNRRAPGARGRPRFRRRDCSPRPARRARQPLRPSAGRVGERTATARSARARAGTGRRRRRGSGRCGRTAASPNGSARQDALADRAARPRRGSARVMLLGGEQRRRWRPPPGRQQRPLADRVAEAAGEEDQRGLPVRVDAGRGRAAATRCARASAASRMCASDRRRRRVRAWRRVSREPAPTAGFTTNSRAGMSRQETARAPRSASVAGLDESRSAPPARRRAPARAGSACR